jgi:hypothetical protein
LAFLLAISAENRTSNVRDASAVSNFGQDTSQSVNDKRKTPNDKWKITRTLPLVGSDVLEWG